MLFKDENHKIPRTAYANFGAITNRVGKSVFGLRLLIPIGVSRLPTQFVIEPIIST